MEDTGPTLRILVVENHGALASVLCRYLVSHRHRVNHSRDLRSARVELGTQEFDLMISDVMLPDGECFLLMGEEPPAAPRFVITMSAFDVRVPETTRGSFHLVKPFPCEDLDRLLRRFTEELALADLREQP